MLPGVEPGAGVFAGDDAVLETELGSRGVFGGGPASVEGDGVRSDGRGQGVDDGWGEGLFDVGELDDRGVGPLVAVAEALGAHDVDVEAVGFLVEGALRVEVGAVLNDLVILAEDTDGGFWCRTDGLEDEVAGGSAFPNRSGVLVVDDRVEGVVVL